MSAWRPMPEGRSGVRVNPGEVQNTSGMPTKGGVGQGGGDVEASASQESQCSTKEASWQPENGDCDIHSHDS